MRAMVMAAGRGSRLRPYTDAVPKPALPVVNEPAMGFALRLLAAHGVRHVVANASWKADVLQKVFGDGTAYGVQLTWSVEDQMLGTAGGVKQAEQSLREGDEPIIVLSGDGLHEADLSDLVRAHRQAGAQVTIGLIEVDDPSQYGVTILDSDGWVTAFQEKPEPGTELSRLANTGIYVLAPEVFDMLPPAGEFYDFGEQLFPAMVAGDGKLLGHKLSTYWNDIGGAEAWLDANLAVLEGKISSAHAVLEEAADGVLIHPDARVHPDAMIVGPVVIGAGATVGQGASVVRSVVLPGTHVAEGTAISGGVVGDLQDLIDWADSLAADTSIPVTNNS